MNARTSSNSEVIVEWDKGKRNRGRTREGKQKMQKCSRNDSDGFSVS
jgi:hypothetical protein